MAFNIKNDEADLLLRELTTLTGESLTDAVIVSLRERIERERRLQGLRGPDLLGAAVEHFRSLRVKDHRSEDEILGYDEHGVPG